MADNDPVRYPVAVCSTCAACAVTAASMLLSGCVSTQEGRAVRAHGSGPLNVAPLDEAKLDHVLLTVDELNRIVDSTRMEITSELDEMNDHSADVSDPDCLGAVYGAEAPVYAGTDWTAMRDQVAREPDDDNDHWVEQTVVLYPEVRNAQDLFADSSAAWQDCANAAIAVGEGDYLWLLGDVGVGDTLITQRTTQEGADGWACQHALSVVSNVTVEAWACGYSITDEAAEIADAMIQNAAE
jgi:hypothetical protein